MKNGSQRTEGCILLLKSKTFILSFLSQIIPHRQTTTFIVRCTVTRVYAARDERHGAGRLLAVQHDNQLVSYFVGHPMNTKDSESIDSFFTILMHLAAQHGDIPKLRHLYCRAPEEHARFRINRLITTILMRLGAELNRRYLEPEYAPQLFLRVHRPHTAHRQQAGGTVQHLIHLHGDHWRGLRSTL